MHVSEANFFPKSASTQISLGPKIFFTKESEPFVDKSPRWILSGQWMAGEGPLKAEQWSLIFFFFWQRRAVHRILAPPGLKLCHLPWKRGVLTTGPSGMS